MKVIVGLGKTGFSFIDYFQGEELVMSDTRENPPLLSAFQEKYSHIPFAPLTTELLTSAERIFLSPGVDWRLPVFAPFAEKISGELDVFLPNAKAPIIAITGSNGKTTVTTLVGELFRDAQHSVFVGGNIGTPMLSALSENYEAYVLELSSFQLQLAHEMKSHAAVVLNITPDHLDRHASFLEYQAAKWRIYQGCDIPVMNTDLWECTDSITYAVQRTADWCVLGQNVMHRGKLFCSLEALGLKKLHEVSNILAALALGEAAGLPLASMKKTVQDFRGLPHRCETVLVRNGVTWINDSKATNVGATIAAVESIGAHSPLIMIVGGQAKTPLSDLCECFSRYVKTVIAIGEAAPEFARLMKSVTCVNNLKEAIQLAHKLAVAKDCVLLSPACASYDLFMNYEDRGNQFRKLVKEVVCSDENSLI